MVDAPSLGKSKWTLIGHSIDDSISGTKLSCGIHDCPQRCHQLSDHTKMECHEIVKLVCSRDHTLSRMCFEKDLSCTVCDTEELKRQRDHKLEVERELKQKEYARQLAELQDDIAHQRRILRDRSEQEERERVLRQHQQDLAILRDTIGEVTRIRILDDSVTSPGSQVSTVAASPDAATTSTPDTKQAVTEDQDKGSLRPWTSNAKVDWEHQKEFEGARNKALDSLMDMIGLEDVKDKFLSIKSRVDTAIRQNVNMKDERFGAVLLGNPGTGAP
jgi:hypothetical protein